MSAQYTPGPLSVEALPFGDNDYLTEVVVPGRAGNFGTSVATCHHNWREATSGERKISWAEAQANARLYAAAPELLTTCESMIPARCCLTNPNIPDSTVVPMEATMGELRALAAAIAKARGQ